MGDHDTFFTLLPFWHAFEHTFEEGLRRDWRYLMFQDTHFTLTHVVSAIMACAFIVFCALRYRSSLNDATQGVVPGSRYSLAVMLDGFVGAVYKLGVDVLGEKDARKFLPFIGTLALFIFCCNLQALIPGFLPPTDTLKTNVALAVIVFVLYNVMGVYRNGTAYLAHFLGPKIGGFPWMFPLLLPIEIVGHFVRPVSLSLRLMGNIMADHKVVLAIGSMLPLLAPVPFLMLGVMVVIVQTMVFTLLTTVYIGLAIEEAEHH